MRARSLAIVVAAALGGATGVMLPLVGATSRADAAIPDPGAGRAIVQLSVGDMRTTGGGVSPLGV